VTAGSRGNLVSRAGAFAACMKRTPRHLLEQLCQVGLAQFGTNDGDTGIGEIYTVGPTGSLEPDAVFYVETGASGKHYYAMRPAWQRGV